MRRSWSRTPRNVRRGAVRPPALGVSEVVGEVVVPALACGACAVLLALILF